MRGPNEMMNVTLRMLSSMAPTEEMLGVHVGLRKYIWVHMNLQERGLRLSQNLQWRCLGSMWDVEFTGDISWSMWILQENYLGSYLIAINDLSPIKRIRRISYLAKNWGRKSAQVQNQKPVFVPVDCTFRIWINRRKQCFMNYNHLNKLRKHHYEQS